MQKFSTSNANCIHKPRWQTKQVLQGKADSALVSTMKADPGDRAV